MGNMSKIGKIYIFGVIILSILTLGIANYFLIQNITNNEKTHEMNMIDDIYVEAKNIDQQIHRIQNSLHVLKAMIKDQLNYTETTETDVFNILSYSDELNVSYFDVNSVSQGENYGNFFLQGNESTVNGFTYKELNGAVKLFNLEKAFINAIDLNLIYSYYSSNDFFTSYPYNNYGEDFLNNVQQTNSQIKEVLENLNNLPDEDYEDVVGSGSTNVIYNSATMKYEYIYTLPIEWNNRIVSILQVKVDEDELYKLEGTQQLDKFYLNKNNSIMLSSYENLGDMDFSDFVANNYNEVNFYNNKFPVEYEVRDETGYKFYILNGLENDSKLVFIEKYNKVMNMFEILVVDSLLIIVIIGIVYLVVINDSRYGDKLELFIKKSKYDGMTELLNHEHVIEAFENFNNSKRIKKVSIMMMDIDNFKNVNDTYGHSIGDEVIGICADAIRLVINHSNSFAGRYGGEEFILILKGCDGNDAYSVGEEIRVLFRKLCKERLELDITISIGVHSYEKPTNNDPMDLINKADKNLYKAKRTGKNRIVLDDEINIG